MKRSRAYGFLDRSPLADQLPIELLERVFLYIIVPPGGTATLQLPRKNWSCEPQWTLSQVCSHWRTVMRSMNDAWSNVTLGNRPLNSHTLNVFEAYLIANQHIYNLSVDLKLSRSSPFASEVLKRIYVPFAAQYGCLTLACVPKTIIPWFDIPKALFRSLRIMRINIYEESEENKNAAYDDDSDCDSDVIAPDGETGYKSERQVSSAYITQWSKEILAFSDMPELTSVVIADTSKTTWVRPHLFKFPWKQIATLELRVSVPLILSVLHVLSQCTVLEKLTLYLSWQNGEANLHNLAEFDKPVPLPMLRELNISGHLGVGDSTFLPSLCLPRLEKAWFGGSYGRKWPSKEWITLVNQSSFTLRSLYISYQLLPDDALDLLKSVPSLRSLEMNGATLGPMAARLISSGKVGRKLRRIEMKLDDTEDLEPYLTLLEARADYPIEEGDSEEAISRITDMQLSYFSMPAGNLRSIMARVGRLKLLHNITLNLVVFGSLNCSSVEGDVVSQLTKYSTHLTDI